MLCPAVRHGMPASWRAVPRPAPARNDRTSARGQGAGQMGGGHADAESGTNTPMLLARSRGPDDHLVGVPTCVHPRSRDLLVRRCSWVARSPRQSGSHFHAVDAWRPDHLAGPGRPRGAAAKACLGGVTNSRSEENLRRTQQPPPVIAVGFYGAWTRYPKRPRMYFTRSGDEERGHFDSLHRAGRRLMLCWFGQRPPDSSAFGKGCVWLASSSEMVAPRAAASSSSVGTASRTDGGRAS